MLSRLFAQNIVRLTSRTPIKYLSTTQIALQKARVQLPAPDFKGQAVVDGQFKEISLSDFKGKWLVLFFYPLDFTFVCPTEIIAFSDSIKQFKNIDCEVNFFHILCLTSYRLSFENSKLSDGLSQKNRIKKLYLQIFVFGAVIT